MVKTLIWSLSLGSGTSGGVLAPVHDRGGASTVAQLLHARRRDLHEEHHRERVLLLKNVLNG